MGGGPSNVLVITKTTDPLNLLAFPYPCACNYFTLPTVTRHTYLGYGRLISQHTEEIKCQFVCAFIHACIYHYMRNLTQNLVATSYSQFYLVSYHTQKPHLDNFNLYHLVKMSSPTFSATIPFSMTS